VVAFLLWLPAARAFADPVVHIVQPGDTLYNLARRYGTTVEAIEQANGLHNASLIYRGQHLVIPDSTGEDGSFQPMSRVSSPPAYTVQPGDTLVGIAVRFGVTVRELAAVNHLAQWDLIFAGQQLRLPAVALGVQGNPVPPGVKRIEIDVSEQRMRVYEGDSLIWDWPASTGLPGYPTRYGRFQVLDKIPMAYSRPWKLWMPHWLGIYWAGGSENGIHSLPIINGRKLWAGYLGSKISYGCIVIGTAEGEQLFNWADVGTAVEIHE
jgi:LysM repeat protein